MTNELIKTLIDGALSDCKTPNIGLSGGEAFYYLDDLLEIANYATSKGARIAINTNCFWAADPIETRRIVRLVKEAKVTKLVASTDSFHKKYIDDNCVVNAIAACVEEHLEIEVQYVATKRTERLHDFLKRNADTLTNVTCREIPCHPVGRAENISRRTLIMRSDIPKATCPNAVLSVSADGRYIPCCNSAGHLPALELGRVGDDQNLVFKRFINSPTMAYLWEEGPAKFIPAAKIAGFKGSPLGYVDQCHLCYELFRNEKIAKAIKIKAEEWAFNKIYGEYIHEFDAGITP